MTKHTHEYGMTIGKTAEHQMRQWALGLEIQKRVEHEQAVAELPEQVHPYVAISREAGASASEVSTLVGERLGWQVLNRELLHYMAEEYHLQPAMVDLVDETTVSWLMEVFGKWLSRRYVSQSEYVARLGEIVLMAVHHHGAVFVGRGAQFFLPRERGLAVRLVAPLKQRVERIIERHGFDQTAAQKYIEKTERARGEFIRGHFHHDVTDAHLYDLVINMERFDVEAATDIIAGEVQRRFGDELTS